jgi:hypothetical protein
LANSLITQTAPINYVAGLLVNSNNFANDQANSVNHTGEAVCAILGVVDALPAYNPVTIVPSGLVLTIGGNGADGSPQLLVTQGRLCDYIPVSTFNTTTATGNVSTRIDLLAVKFATVSVSGIVADQIVKNSLGINNSQSIGINYNGVVWDYVTGTPGSGQPATPSGYEAFATITMAAGASAVTTSQIANLFPTVAAALNTTESQKFGVQTGVPADGSAESTVTFSTPFPTSLDNAQLTVNLNGVAGGNVLNPQVDISLGAGSFKIYVTGGPIGTTVSVNWVAWGH